MSERIRVITEDQYKEYMELKKQFDQDNNVSSKKGRWKPKDGERFYYIDRDGFILDSNAHYDVLSFIERAYDFHNIFKTGEEAQKEHDRRLAEQELLDLCDWEEGSSCYEIEYNFNEKCFKADSYITYYCFSPYRFASQYAAQKAIDMIGEDKLKLIFRID